MRQQVRLGRNRPRGYLPFLDVPSLLFREFIKGSKRDLLKSVLELQLILSLMPGITAFLSERRNQISYQLDELLTSLKKHSSLSIRSSEIDSGNYPDFLSCLKRKNFIWVGLFTLLNWTSWPNDDRKKHSKATGGRVGCKIRLFGWEREKRLDWSSAKSGGIECPSSLREKVERYGFGRNVTWQGKSLGRGRIG